MATLEEIRRQIYGPVLRSARFSGPRDRERESALNSLAGSSLSALQYIGQTLDKPGRSIRGLAAGKPEELLNLVPFSSTIGLTDRDGWLGDFIALTDDANYTSGRDLLRQQGLISPQDTWGNFAAGMGVEIATDPLSFVTLGSSSALSRGGAIAARAGVLPRTATARLGGSLRSLLDNAVANQGDDLLGRLTAAAGGDLTDDLLDQPLAGMVGFGMPFRAPSIIPTPGPRSQALGRFIDDNYEILKYGDTGFLGGVVGSGFRKGRELLDSSLRGSGHAATQRAMDMVPAAAGQGGRTVRETIEHRTAQMTQGLYDDLRRLGQAEINPLDPDFSRRILSAREQTWAGAPPTLEARRQMAAASGRSLSDMAVEEAFRDSGLTLKQIEAIKPIVARHADEFAQSLAERQEIGFGSRALQDETINYAPRDMRGGTFSQREEGRHQTAPTANRHTNQRSAAARNLGPTQQRPGGTVSLMQMMEDPILGKQLQRSIKSDLLDDPSEALVDVFRQQAEAAGVKNVDELASGAARWQMRGMIRQLQRGEQPTLVQRPPRNPADRAAQGAVEHVYREYMAWTPEEGAQRLTRYQELKQLQTDLAESGRGLQTDEQEFVNAMEANLRQARIHAGWIRNLPPDAQYDPRLFDVARGALQKATQQAEMGKAVHRALVYGGEFMETASGLTGEALEVTGEMRTQLPLGTERISALHVLERAGMKDRGQAIRYFAETMAQLRPEVLADEFGENWIEILRNNGADSAEILSWLDKWTVDRKLADDLLKVMDFTTDPRSLSPILDTWDKLTSSLKSSLTSPWLAFASRNLQSLFWMDGVAGGFQDPANMLKWWNNTRRFLRGDTIQGASEIPAVRQEWMRRAGNDAAQATGTLTDEEATQILREMFAAHQVSPIGFGDAVDRPNTMPGPVDDLSRSTLQAELPQSVS